MFPINEESCNVNSVGRVQMEGNPETEHPRVGLVTSLRVECT